MRDLLKLALLLQQIVEEENLQGQFEWPVPEDCPIAVPDFAGDCFKQNVYLKEHYAPQLQSDPQLRAHYWLIQQWGGIKSFKQNPQNDRKILQFLEALAAAEPSSKLYDTLPSLSKVSSFLMPDDYVIYDARVAYSLNWLIFAHDLDLEFFPQPVSRNAQLQKFEQQTIFNLMGCTRAYVPKPQAYLALCSLIKALVSHPDTPWQKPYEVEMILFSIAPGYIVQDIQKRIQVRKTAAAPAAAARTEMA